MDSRPTDPYGPYGRRTFAGMTITLRRQEPLPDDIKRGCKERVPYSAGNPYKQASLYYFKYINFIVE